jgi:glycosyltransferase involved in cell wall biosynthesis
LGPAKHRRSDYLQRKLGISPDKKIVLHTGSIEAFTCAPQLLLSTKDWPDNWVLVFHTRYKSTGLDSDYLATLRYLAKNGRVLFSFEPVPKDEYIDLVRSADVGVAFYCTQPGSSYWKDNIRYIGLSSGKLAYYLQAGLPVLVNDVGSLKQLVSKHNCGKIVEDPACTADAIEHIFEDYEYFSSNAVSCFNDKFNYESNFALVLTELERLKHCQA